MGNVHDKSTRNDAKVVASPNQVVEPRDLVEPVIHEPFVECWQGRRFLHHHVGLLDVVEPARNQRVMIRTVRQKPPFIQVVLLLISPARVYVC